MLCGCVCRNLASELSFPLEHSVSAQGIAFLTALLEKDPRQRLGARSTRQVPAGPVAAPAAAPRLVFTRLTYIAKTGTGPRMV